MLTFSVRTPDGTPLGKIEMTSDGPAGKRYAATLRDLDGGVVGRVYSGDDELARAPRSKTRSRVFAKAPRSIGSGGRLCCIDAQRAPQWPPRRSSS